MRKLKYIAIAMAMPLAVCAGLPVQNQLVMSDAVTGQISNQVVRVRQINPTTVELVYANGQYLTIDFYGENIFRLFQDNKGGIVRDPDATPKADILVENPRRSFESSEALRIELTEGVAAIKTNKVSIQVNCQSGLMNVFNAEGEKVIEMLEPFGFHATNTTLTLKEEKDEYFYGGGVQNGRFSHKGMEIAIVNTNNWMDGGVASPTPFYWSTKGYGMMWHTFKPGSYNFGEKEEGKVVLTHEEKYLDVFFMVDDSPVALLNDFYQLTGHPVLLPKFGFYQGHLNAYNRDYWKEAPTGKMKFEDGKYYVENQVDNGGVKESLNGELPGNYQFSARAAIDRYIKNDMPLGWFLPNDGYGAGYGQTATLEGNIQNLKDFGDYARSKGVEIGLWTQSNLHPKEGVEALLQRDIVKEVRNAGVRVLKTDVAWVGDGYSFGLNGVADVGQIMPYYGSDARPFIITLDGWAGTQRFASVWSGDQTGGDWEYIRFHIPTFIGSGLSGQPNITNDLDGIFGGKNLPVNVREFQWKTFTPMVLNMDGWGANAKYPQALGEPATSINRWYSKMKSELMPYAYTIAHEAITGKPMIRAMFLDDPNEYTLGTATQYQFLYGPNFLIAPIYKETAMDQEGNDMRDGIYLPEGKWVDYFSGDVYEGGRVINNFETPLWKIPVFVKSHAIIPMTHPNNNPNEIDAAYRAYEIYADAEKAAFFKEYDDDGKTQSYLRDASTETCVSAVVKGDQLTVSVEPTKGHFSGFVPDKRTEFRINVTKAPKKVVAKVGEKKVTLKVTSSLDDFNTSDDCYFYNARPNLNRFATKDSAFEKVEIIKNPQLLVKLGKTDVTSNAVCVEVKGFEFAPADRLRISGGTLEAPKVTFTEEAIQPYDLTPSWSKVENADYYEVEFNDMLYSTIKDLKLNFDALDVETTYNFKVRAVNKDGCSEWVSTSATTKSDPLEFAIKGIKAAVTCADQPGQTIDKLFDFDTKSIWHTMYGEKAAPFEMTIDLRSVNELDRLVYTPRPDAGNGTLLEANISYSVDKQQWSDPQPVKWERSSEVKSFAFEQNPKARYIKLSVNKSVGHFGSGHEMYVFKVANTESLLQGDINRDQRIDDNDLTSYMNYTGLRKVDSDFDYVSIGDINGNGLIDAYDISVVTTELGGGVSASSNKVAGTLLLTPNKTSYQLGETAEVKVSGKGLHFVNGLSFGLPYSTDDWEYVGLEVLNMKDMLDLTKDRLHSDGQKALYPTFVNKGTDFLLDEGDNDLFIIRFKAKRAGKFNLKAVDGLLIDRNLGSVKF